jgi:hypothetical protein
MGKIIVKKTTQVSGHFLTLHFCMFEKSQDEHNSLDCIFFWEYFSLISVFTCSKFDTNKFKNCMFETLKLRKWTILFFSKIIFPTKCAPFLLKIEEDLNIDN